MELYRNEVKRYQNQTRKPICKAIDSEVEQSIKRYTNQNLMIPKKLYLDQNYSGVLVGQKKINLKLFLMNKCNQKTL